MLIALVIIASTDTLMNALILWYVAMHYHQGRGRNREETNAVS